ncbi:MAG: FAD-dependent oxidoreductase [Coriobacteriia bacterium]|nr:FAD-dependent oxidoreductase [Coriobacteriia bacterium]
MASKTCTYAALPDAIDLVSYDAVVVGSGFAGSVLARELAERGELRVAILERRPQIGGNAFDCLDSQGVLIHEFGPHIYHTGSERVHGYLSRFTDWLAYRHEVLAFIDGNYIPVPFNLNSIEQSFATEKADALKAALLAAYPEGSKVTILELREQKNGLLKELADYVYEKVFVYYTMKQWGLSPEEIDPAVTARVPVLVGRDNRYFQDRYQGMPAEGYTALFQRLLDYPGIDIFLNTDAVTDAHLQLSSVGEKGVAGAGPDGGAAGSGTADTADAPFTAITLQGKAYNGLVIYTGALDELAGYRFGQLPYRSLDFVYRRYPQKHVQPCGTVNFTVSEDYTRTTEYTWLTGQDLEVTTVAEEYPRAFLDPQSQIPYYPVFTEANQAAYDSYKALFQRLPDFYLAGRLAEYRYYNIDQIVERALALADGILEA